jgi:sphingolipid 4-desaturase/C4-monooxygenase
MQHDKFYEAEYNQPHPQRTREILQKYPQVKTLFGKNPWTAAIMVFVLVLQTSLAFAMGKLGMHYWWLSLIVAFGIGAFANHCMYVIIHESTHNMVFESKIANRWVAILADMPNLFPASMGFFVYHLKHHTHQGDYDQDADMANRWEAKLIGNSTLGKAIWMLFFPLFQLTRPPRLKTIAMFSKWSWINLTTAIIYDCAIVYFCGWWGLAYLFFSFDFSIGLHPVGARWIQEHFTPDGEQETFSYYGPINIVALNVGYHNEHHDFPAIPWHNLPKLRAMAPEYYNTLKYHTSWFKLWLEFLFDSRYSLFSRVERIQDGKVPIKVKAA